MTLVINELASDHGGHRRGRRLALTGARADAIVACRRAGYGHTDTAACVGLHRSTLTRYRRRGEVLESELHDLGHLEQVAHDVLVAGDEHAVLQLLDGLGWCRDDQTILTLHLRAAQAEAEHELRLVQVVWQAALDGNWRAASWLLERRFPQRWARRRDAAVAPQR